MKVLCNNCGKRFDAQLCGGVCPHCGRFQSLAEREAAARPTQHPAPRAQQTAGYSYTQAVPQRGTAKAKGRGMAWKLPLVLLILATILFFALICYSIALDEKGGSLLPQTQADIPLATLWQQQNEAFTLQRPNRTLTVGKAEYAPDIPALDENSTLVRVWMEKQKSERYESRVETLLYLQADGSYYRAEGEYSLVSDGIAQKLELLSESSIAATSMDEGWVYFVVPKGATGLVLWIQVQVKSDDYEIQEVDMIGIPLTIETQVQQ